jgi:hypothetical protein
MEPRRTTAWSPGSLARIAAALCAFGLGSCQGTQVRAVVHDRPLIDATEVEAGPIESPPVQQFEASVEVEVPAIEGAFGTLGRVEVTAAAATLAEVPGDRPLQLDTVMGALGLDYPLLLDLGSRSGTGDNGVETIHAAEAKRSDFSDMIIELEWRESIRPGWSITGGACMFRHQDLGILDGLGAARFGWATLGIAMRF